MKKYLLRELSREYLLSTSEIIEESKALQKYEVLKNGNYLFKNVLLQEAEKENGNGRIYPLERTKQQVKQYENKIKIKQAVGELSHPECIREGAKILTFDGWKDFRNISDDEIVLTYNTSSDKLEYQKITKKIVQYVEDEEMIEFDSQTIKTCVTKNHRFYLKNRHGKGDFYTAQELKDNRIQYNHFYIPKIGSYVPSNVNDTFILPKLENIGKMTKKLKEKYSKNIEIDINHFSSFLGLYLAEGYCGKRPGTYAIKIYQNEGEKSEKIEELLKKLPFEFKIKKRTSKLGNTNIIYTITDMRLNLYLRKLGCAWEKYIPVEMKNIKKEYLLNILEWFHLGDGRTYLHEGIWEKKEIFSTSRKLIEDLQEIALKCEIPSNIRTEKRNKKDTLIEGRIIKAENKRDMHFVSLTNKKLNKGLYITSNSVKIENIKYSGNVYCVQVPNQTFFCMNENKVFLSGNSAVIDPNNICLHIDKIWMEGKQVRGDVRIISTTTRGKEAIGLIDSDITLGISSRSVGSVGRNKRVDDDFEYICWDAVIDPSTENAFINESKLIEVNVPLITESIYILQKFDKLLKIRGL